MAQQLALEVVLALVEGLEHRLAPVGGGVDAQQRARARAGDERVDARTGQRRRLIGPGGLGRVDGDVLEVREDLCSARGQRQRGRERELSATHRVGRTQPIVAARNDVGGDLTNREVVLERLQLAPLGICHAHRAGNRRHHALVVGNLGSVRQRRREGGERHTAGACAVGDHRGVRNSLALERVGPILVGDAGVADAGIGDAGSVGEVRVGSVGDEQDPHSDPLRGSRGRCDRGARPASGNANERHEAADNGENYKETSHTKLGFKFEDHANHQHQARRRNVRCRSHTPTGFGEAPVSRLSGRLRMGLLAPLTFIPERGELPRQRESSAAVAALRCGHPHAGAMRPMSRRGCTTPRAQAKPAHDGLSRKGSARA
jgi:hypothetical protein